MEVALSNPIAVGRCSLKTTVVTTILMQTWKTWKMTVKVIQMLTAVVIPQQMIWMMILL